MQHELMAPLEALGGDAPAIPPPGVHLSELLGRETLVPERALGYAVDVAAELVRMHRRGRAHGAVEPRHILVEDGKARLDAAKTGPECSVGDDCERFGLVLRSLISAAESRGADAPVPEVLKALTRVASSYWPAEAEKRPCDLKKAALALKLLQLEFARDVTFEELAQRPAAVAGTENPSPSPSPAPGPAPAPGPRRRKVMMLVRVVPLRAAGEATEADVSDGSLRWWLVLALLAALLLGCFLGFQYVMPWLKGMLSR